MSPEISLFVKKKKFLKTGTPDSAHHNFLSVP